MLESVATFEDDFNHIIDLQQTIRMAVPFEGMARYILHNDIMQVVFVASIKHRDNIGVAQLTGQAGFIDKHCFEASPIGLIFEDIFVGNLDGYIAIGEGVLCQINGRSCTFAN